MRCLISRIPIDIVEIVIISSDSYKLFEQLKYLLPKLTQNSRLVRINDKMTHVYNNGRWLEYKLDGRYHREYNKPYFVSALATIDCSIYSYHFQRKTGYHIINIGCRRDMIDFIYKHIMYISNQSYSLYEKVYKQIRLHIK